MSHLRTFVMTILCAAICIACGATYDVEAWSSLRARHFNVRTGDTISSPATVVRATDYGIQLLFTTAPMLSISSGAIPASRQQLLNNVIQQVFISANKPIDTLQPGENLHGIFLADIAGDGFQLTLDSFVRRPPVRVTDQLNIRLNRTLGRRDTITFRIDVAILPPRRLSFTLPPVILE
ncbi:hypothetical protein [Rhodoflexus sp.]